MFVVLNENQAPIIGTLSNTVEEAMEKFYHLYPDVSSKNFLKEGYSVSETERLEWQRKLLPII